jgi:aquaporin Z
MNSARSLGPALVLGNWTSWWAYLLGPAIGALLAVGIAQILRGPGGGSSGTRAAQGTLGTLWLPARIGEPQPAPERPVRGGPAGSGPVTDSPAQGPPGDEASADGGADKDGT